MDQTCLDGRPGSSGRSAPTAEVLAAAKALDPEERYPGSEPAALGYCIRVPSRVESLPCPSCGRMFRVAGPTGFLGPHPICDGCLLNGDRRLGMVLTMIAVCRRYGGLIPADAAEEQLHQRELLAFARVYERFAARSGPPRPWADFLAEDPLIS